MANIISKSEGLNKRAVFTIMNGQSGKLSTYDGVQFTIKDYILYEDVNQQGQNQKLLAIVTEDGDIMTTNSGTAIRTFEKMLEQGFELPIEDVQIVSGTTKAGRTYYDLKLIV